MRKLRPSSLRANIVTVVVLASGLAIGLFTALIIYMNARRSISPFSLR